MKKTRGAQPERRGLPRIKPRYWAMFFTLSPVWNPEPETAEQTAEPSSTSVAWMTPTEVVRRRITLPVDGSLISLLTLTTSSLSPTLTPALLPTLSTICPPSTAAIRPSIVTVTVCTLTLEAFGTRSAVSLSTAVLVASPMMVLWKSLLPKSALPPPKPCQLPPPPSMEVLERLDWPLPSATAMISAVSTLMRRAVMPTLALELEWPT